MSKISFAARSLGLIAALVVVPATFADPVLDRIGARGHAIVSVKKEGERKKNAHKDPAHFEKRTFEVGIAREIAKALPGDAAQLELRMMRRPARLSAVAQGEVDFALSMLRVTPAAEAQVDFSRPYFMSALAVLQRQGGSLAALSDLNGKTVAYIARNDDGAGDLPGSITPASVTEFPDFDEAVAALKAGKIDALVSEASNIEIYLRDKPDGALASSPRLLEQPVGVAVQKGNPALLKAVNTVLGGLVASGQLETMARAAGLPAALQR